ncbi:hypothetical protein F383_28839 [Gossypium arboreum]|uniref:Uncharacterized protein n=1 Tax=Gossypium arboreum TaxID=29729 RepID=A0A0B0PJS6_GOSAR|nr:hypothetical protein F383_28839 [Gossypium arboreum]
MSQTCLTLAYVSRPMHVPDMSYTSSRLNADAMSQTWSYTDYHLVANACPRHVLHWLMSRGQCMSQTCLTLALVSMLMPCPRHGLTLTIIS